jgi:hypothetical protein
VLTISEADHRGIIYSFKQMSVWKNGEVSWNAIDNMKYEPIANERDIIPGKKQVCTNNYLLQNCIFNQQEPKTIYPYPHETSDAHDSFSEYTNIKDKGYALDAKRAGDALKVYKTLQLQTDPCYLYILTTGDLLAFTHARIRGVPAIYMAKNVLFMYNPYNPDLNGIYRNGHSINRTRQGGGEIDNSYDDQEMQEMQEMNEEFMNQINNPSTNNPGESAVSELVNHGATSSHPNNLGKQPSANSVNHGATSSLNKNPSESAVSELVNHGDTSPPPNNSGKQPSANSVNDGATSPPPNNSGKQTSANSVNDGATSKIQTDLTIPKMEYIILKAEENSNNTDIKYYTSAFVKAMRSIEEKIKESSEVPMEPNILYRDFLYDANMIEHLIEAERNNGQKQRLVNILLSKCHKFFISRMEYLHKLIGEQRRMSSGQNHIFSDVYYEIGNKLHNIDELFKDFKNIPSFNTIIYTPEDPSKLQQSMTINSAKGGGALTSNLLIHSMNKFSSQICVTSIIVMLFVMLNSIHIKYIQETHTQHKHICILLNLIVNTILLMIVLLVTTDPLLDMFVMVIYLASNFYFMHSVYTKNT